MLFQKAPGKRLASRRPPYRLDDDVDELAGF
jgi:hypothetical protein